jgi:hypothetical protein
MIDLPGRAKFRFSRFVDQARPRAEEDGIRAAGN